MDATQAPWWSIASTVAIAVATVTLAIFAAVQMAALRAQRKERERVSGARIAATGFLVRRQIRSWLGEAAGSEDDFEIWIRDAQNAGSLRKHLDVAESRFVEMLGHAAEAARDVAASVRTAAVLFFSGASRLNDFVNTPQPHGIAIADWINLRNIAWRDFRDCVRKLDDDVGVAVLLQEAQLLDAKRKAEFPSANVLIQKFAKGLAKLEEEQRK